MDVEVCWLPLSAEDSVILPLLFAPFSYCQDLIEHAGAGLRCPIPAGPLCSTEPPVLLIPWISGSLHVGQGSKWIVTETS